MTSHTTSSFRRLFRLLPTDVRRAAEAAYDRWRVEPRHPSLHFKRVHRTLPIFSVRVGIGWRAVGTRDGDAMIWFWIGSHADYDQLLRSF